METSSALLALCAGNSPVNSPHKGQWRGALMFSLICAINGWVNNREAGELRHDCTHYDVIVMVCSEPGGQKWVLPLSLHLIDAIFLMLRQEHSWRTKLISWLPMTWLLVLPGHPQLSHQLYRINRSLSSRRKNFNYMNLLGSSVLGIDRNCQYISCFIKQITT